MRDMAGKSLSTEPTIDPSAKLQEAIAERLVRLAWWDHVALRLALPDFRQFEIGGFLNKYEAALDAGQPLGQSARS